MCWYIEDQHVQNAGPKLGYRALYKGTYLSDLIFKSIEYPTAPFIGISMGLRNSNQ